MAAQLALRRASSRLLERPSRTINACLLQPGRGSLLQHRRLLFTKGAKNYVDNSNNDVVQYWLKTLKKELYLLRGTMIKRRPFNVPVFLQGFLTSQRNTAYTMKKGEQGVPSQSLFTMSYSEIAGHTAFLFSLMMYLETELFNLSLKW